MAFSRPTKPFKFPKTIVGSSTETPVLTVDSRGIITNVSSASIAGGGGGSPSGPAGGDLTGSYPNPTLKDILTGIGPIGSATTTPTITIDNKGRVTALSSTSIQIAESQVTNLVTDLANLSSSIASVSSSNNNKVSRTGDTMTGTLVISSSLVVTGNATFTGSVVASGAFSAGNYIQMLPVGNVAIPTNQTASYIYTSGSTNDMYFTQYLPGTSYTNTTRLRWLESTLSTGLLRGGTLSTVNGTTTFNITSGSGLIVSQNVTFANEPYPTIQYISWNNFVSQSLPSISSSQITYIALNSSGSIVRSNAPFSDGDFNNYIILGRILHQTGSVTNGAASVPNVAYGVTQNKNDFYRAFGPLKLSGHTLSESGSLGLRKTAGESFAIGRNYTVDPNLPNYISSTTDIAINTSKIFREYVSGSSLVLDTGIANAGYTVIDPTKRVDTTTGLLTSVPGGKYTIQRVFWFPNSINKAFHVYYGSTEYVSLDTAQSGIATEEFTEDRYTSTEAIFLGYILIKSGGASISADGRIVQAGIARGIGFGSGGGGSGGGGVPSGPAGGDLAGTYPNPTLAEITTASTVGSATVVPVVTIDAKGRVTTLSSATITGVTPGGSAGGDLTGSYPNPTLASIITGSTVGSATIVPVVTTDAKGRITNLSSASIQIAESQVTNLVTDLATINTNYSTLSSSLAAVSSSDAGKVNRTGDTMTGNLTLVSGSNSVSPLKFVSGSLLGTPTAGNMEYDGTNLYFTTGSVREFVALSGSLATKVSKAGDRMTGALGINNGSTAISATDLHIGSGNISIAGSVSTRLEPVISSPGNFPRTLTFHPTYTGNTGVNAIALQVLPEISGAGVSMPELYGISSAFTGSATKWIGLAVLDGGGTATTKYDAIFNGGGNVGVGTSTPAAKFEVSGQTRANAIGINRSGGTITATDLQIGSGSTAFDGNVSIQIEPVISSPGNFPRTMFFHPKYTGNTTNNAISLQVQPEVGAAVSMPDLYGISSAFVGSATKWTAIYVYDGGGTATNKYDAIFNGGGNVGIRTTAPTARLQIGAGTATANTAPLKFTSGTNLSAVEAGAMEYDGTNLYFTPVASRKTIGYKRNVVSATSALAATVDSCIIASGSFTITLPNPSTVGSGAEILVKKTSTGTSTVTISASAGTIDGATTTTLTTQYSSYTFISDGSTNWWII